MVKSVKRGFGRQRGRTKQVIRKVGSKMFACSCGNEVKVDADVTSVTCGTCVQKLVPAPAKPKAPKSPEEKALKVARKLERARLREAKRSKIAVVPSGKDLGYTRGWWFKKVFKTAIDEHGQPQKTKFYSLGKEITEAQYDKLSKQFEAEAAARVALAAQKPEVSTKEQYTLASPKGEQVTLTIRGFFKSYGLYSGHLKKLIAGQKSSYNGWTFVKGA